jgi:hypothetical protein
MISWEKQEKRLLEEPGTGPEDGAIGQHPDVVVAGDRAYLFYFVHPGRLTKDEGYEKRRSLIQVAELTFENGNLTCDRNKTTYIKLKKKK